ncbi:hypothetical protein [Friedmanniella luteola]|uniref:hypothetical protein n=1 Tax=Friedmanniella luteola TaxID=546871 RepID=UPI000B85B378|nr:hypothetical protein [Friedmanniella luteola]
MLGGLFEEGGGLVSMVSGALAFPLCACWITGGGGSAARGLLQPVPVDLDIGPSGNHEHAAARSLSRMHPH